MRTWSAWMGGLLLWCWAGSVLAQDPFEVRTRLLAGTPPRLSVQFSVPAEHYLYDHMLSVEALAPETVSLRALDPPKPKRKYDELLEMEVATYGEDTTFTYALDDFEGDSLTVSVSYQGCDESTCFLPQQREFTVRLGEEGTAAGSGAEAAAQPQPQETSGGGEDWRALADRFEVVGKGTGYMGSDKFITFLQQSEEGTIPETNLLESAFERFGIVVALLIVVPLGLLLNLTPCVLPMIPINLAIIGAGNAAGSKRSGFLRGAVYGSGMALVYGILGVVVVLTGSQFGALNASPWFNFAIAAVFVLLGLAMFDVFIIDLSRFQKAAATAEKTAKSPWITAFLLGGTTALLAGACVAPVLIWVLVLATDLYAKGNASGLLLPFMLGLGMAIPWPIAGAGLAALPKPGAWMNTVKHGFGILIFLFAAYYAVLGGKLLMARSGGGDADAVQAQAESGWHASLTKGLREGVRDNKPVFLDFWALTCKSCMKMKKTTFKDPDVLEALDDYVTIAFQTDDMDDPVVKGALDYFDVIGLPTYIVLKPVQTSEQ